MSISSSRTTNLPAYVALYCGIASLVPWVIVITFPCAIVLGLLGLFRSLRRVDRAGRAPALMGIGLALAAASLHLALVGLAGLVSALF